MERHPIDRAQAARELSFNETELAELVASLPRNPHYLEGVFDTARKLTAAAAVHGTVEQVRSAARAIAQSGTAMFTLHRQATAREDRLFRGRIADIEVEIRDYNPVSSLGAVSFLTTSYAAIAVFAADELTKLCEIPIDVIRHSAIEVDEYQYVWIGMLQELCSGTGAPDAIDLERLAASVAFAHIAGANHTDGLLAIARAVLAAAEGDADAFTREISAALACHRRVWDGNPNWQGYISLPATAIAAWGTNHGMRLNLTSDYIPAVAGLWSS